MSRCHFIYFVQLFRFSIDVEFNLTFPLFIAAPIHFTTCTPLVPCHSIVSCSKCVSTVLFSNIGNRWRWWQCWREWIEYLEWFFWQFFTVSWTLHQSLFQWNSNSSTFAIENDEILSVFFWIIGDNSVQMQIASMCLFFFSKSSFIHLFQHNTQHPKRVVHRIRPVSDFSFEISRSEPHDSSFTLWRHGAVVHFHSFTIYFEIFLTTIPTQSSGWACGKAASVPSE